MYKRVNWTTIFLTFLALAIVYGVGTTFFTLELERMVECTITPYILESAKVDRLNQDIYPGIERFMTSNHAKCLDVWAKIV